MSFFIAAAAAPSIPKGGRAPGGQGKAPSSGKPPGGQGRAPDGTRAPRGNPGTGKGGGASGGRGSGGSSSSAGVGRRFFRIHTAPGSAAPAGSPPPGWRPPSSGGGFGSAGATGGLGTFAGLVPFITFGAWAGPLGYYPPDSGEDDAAKGKPDPSKNGTLPGLYPPDAPQPTDPIPVAPFTDRKSVV